MELFFIVLILSLLLVIQTTLNTLKYIVLGLVIVIATASFAFSQESSGQNKQFWAYTYFNWRLNDKWVYNHDFGYQHSYASPSLTTLFTRSQFNSQLSGLFSLHGGLNLIYKINESNSNALEVRPWAGAKLRWPYFWRLNFVHYLRFEERLEVIQSQKDWDSHFRFRYRLSSNVPINHAAITDGTLYGLFAYEIFSVSFGDDLRFTTAATQRFELGLGYQQNIKNRYEFVVMGYNSKAEGSDNYNFSDLVFFLKYRRFINWE